MVPAHKKEIKLGKIFLLPVAGKLFERILYKNMYDPFIENNLISPNQSG